LISVDRRPISTEKLLVLRDDGSVASHAGDANATGNRNSHRQSLQPNGAIYIFSVEDFLETGQIPITGSTPFYMDMIASIDIDTPADWDELRTLEKADAI